MSESMLNNKRIAKNTILLYMRMFLLMGISLFTSRVVLQSLGVEDFGIYNVIGGFVVMFSILTSSLTSAISRFITVELGKKNITRLKIVFSTSVSVQLLMSLIVAILAEIVGIWFINNEMSIPDGRMAATIWVLQCSIVVFILGLLNVPFNSTIVAHEKMSAFAYISILEAILKLSVAYMLYVTTSDKLVVYSALLMVVQFVLLIIYAVYSNKKFCECTLRLRFDERLFKEMWGFAGWNLLGNGAYLLNTQGVNMLMNVFFGVVANAARGIANQVNNAVQQFVNNFMMALTPQITKNYAAGDKQSAFVLACRGARFSYFLMFFISLPIVLEVDQVLKLWLGVVPEGSGAYVNWTILATLTTVIGQTLVTLVMAHGNIKHYQIVITLWGFSPFPLTWAGYASGAPAIWAFVIYFIVYYILIYVRLYLVHGMTGIPYSMYMKDVILRIHVVSILAFLPPFLVSRAIAPSFTRLIITVVLSLLSSSISIVFLGMQKNERSKICVFIKSKITKN